AHVGERVRAHRELGRRPRHEGCLASRRPRCRRSLGVGFGARRLGAQDPYTLSGTSDLVHPSEAAGVSARGVWFCRGAAENPESAMAAGSFCISVTAPDGLARPLATVRAEVASPAGGLVFVSGAMTTDLDRVADQIRAAWRNVPVAIVPGAGVLTERGE